MKSAKLNGAPCTIIVMGVSGSGKSTIGEALAAQIQADFIDGDDLHPASNITKMSHGEALTDADRWPWLELIARQAQQKLNHGKSVVIVCSALKKLYREVFRNNISCVKFVFLDGSYELINARLLGRHNHFMKAGMLQSQFDTLERPDNQEPDVYTADIALPVITLVDNIARHLPCQ